MADVMIGDCPWSDPHPPHLWGETRTYPNGTETLLWACSGEANEDD